MKRALGRVRTTYSKWLADLILKVFDPAVIARTLGRRHSYAVRRAVISEAPLNPLQEAIFQERVLPQLEAVGGDYGKRRDYSAKHIRGLSKESGTIRGVIVDLIERHASQAGRVLLPGEYNRDIGFYKPLFGNPEVRFVTAGIGGDMDFEWNYEMDPPDLGGQFDFIASQAMLEHLVDPFKHMRDCAGLLAPSGVFVVHTHVPGFHFHQHPIDCCRFFPDFFERVAERCKLDILDRYIRDLRICYAYRRPE